MGASHFRGLSCGLIETVPRLDSHFIFVQFEIDSSAQGIIPANPPPLAESLVSESHEKSMFSLSIISLNLRFAGILPNNWDPLLQSQVASAVDGVPDKIYVRGSGNKDQLTISNFLDAYPTLEMIPLPGDGSSCQFEAIALSACGEVERASQLRNLAVERISKEWDTISDLVLSEVASQTGLDMASLDKQRCLDLMTGLNNKPGIWGNAITLAQLPYIVKKNIVVLCLSEGHSFKHVLELEGSSETIHIGFLPEFHYFPVRVKLAKGDKGKHISKTKFGLRCCRPVWYSVHEQRPSASSM